jgi:hypothetical protein
MCFIMLAFLHNAQGGSGGFIVELALLPAFFAFMMLAEMCG